MRKFLESWTMKSVWISDPPLARRLRCTACALLLEVWSLLRKESLHRNTVRSQLFSGLLLQLRQRTVIEFAFSVLFFLPLFCFFFAPSETASLRLSEIHSRDEVLFSTMIKMTVAQRDLAKASFFFETFNAFNFQDYSRNVLRFGALPPMRSRIVVKS